MTAGNVFALKAATVVQPDNHQHIIRINTFGGFSVQVHGECIGVQDWKCTKVFQLLLSLVALGGKDISVTQLMDLIWPDAEGDKSFQNLEFNLRSLRKVLQQHVGGGICGNQIVMVQQGKLSLNADLCMIDTWKWESLTRSAAQAHDAGEHQAAFALEKRAAQLLRGEFLAGEHDMIHSQHGIWQQRCSNWLVKTAHGWHERFSNCHDEQMNLLDIGLQIDPCSEKLCMQRMQVLLNEGYAADALRTYYVWVELIRSTYSLRPSKQAMTLANSLMKA